MASNISFEIVERNQTNSQTNIDSEIDLKSCLNEFSTEYLIQKILNTALQNSEKFEEIKLMLTHKKIVSRDIAISGALQGKYMLFNNLKDVSEKI